MPQLCGLDIGPGTQIARSVRSAAAPARPIGAAACVYNAHIETPSAPRPRPITARCTAVGLLPFLREEFRLFKLILHSELRRRAASRRALPCPSSVKCVFQSLVILLRVVLMLHILCSWINRILVAKAKSCWCCNVGRLMRITSLWLGGILMALECVVSSTYISKDLYNAKVSEESGCIGKWC